VRATNSSAGGGRRAAFTLVELMVMVIILGMLASLTFVSWRAVLPSTELNSAVRELAGTLSEARSDAIARNAEFQIEYYFEETAEHPRGFRVITPFRVGGQGGLAHEDEERLARSWIELPESVRFQAITVDGKTFTTGRVSFDPLGAASDHTIVLVQPEYENRYTIEVLALTGLIRFHDGVFQREPPQEDDFL
jgi:Tfp pilus assembly protein FimT